MKQTIKTPVRILVNGVFILNADEVEMYYESTKDRTEIMPNDWIGQVINIKKAQLTKAEQATTKKAEPTSYDAHWKKFKDFKDSHIPLA